MPDPDSVSEEAAFLRSGDFAKIEVVAGTQIAGLANEGFYDEDEIHDLRSRGEFSDVLNKDERQHYVRRAYRRAEAEGNLGKYESVMERYRGNETQIPTPAQLERIRVIAGPQLSRAIAEGHLLDEVPNLLQRAQEDNPLEAQEKADLLSKVFEHERANRGNTERLQKVLNGEISPDQSVVQRAIGLAMQKEDIERLDEIVGLTASDLLQHLYPQMNGRQQREFVLDVLADNLPCTRDEFLDLICEEFGLTPKPRDEDSGHPLANMIIEFVGRGGQVYAARKASYADAVPHLGAEGVFQMPHGSAGDNGRDPAGSSRASLPDATYGYGIPPGPDDSRLAAAVDVPPLPPIKRGPSASHVDAVPPVFSPPRPPSPPIRPLTGTPGISERLTGRPKSGPRPTVSEQDISGTESEEGEASVFSSRALGADDSSPLEPQSPSDSGVILSDHPPYDGPDDDMYPDRIDQEEHVTTRSSAPGSSDDIDLSELDDLAEPDGSVFRSHASSTPDESRRGEMPEVEDPTLASSASGSSKDSRSPADESGEGVLPGDDILVLADSARVRRAAGIDDPAEGDVSVSRTDSSRRAPAGGVDHSMLGLDDSTDEPRDGRGDTRVDETEPEIDPVRLPDLDPSDSSRRGRSEAPAAAPATEPPPPPSKFRRFLKYSAATLALMYMAVAALYMFADHKYGHVPKRYPNEVTTASITSFVSEVFTPEAPATQEQLQAFTALSQGAANLISDPLVPVSGADGTKVFNLVVKSRLKRFIHPDDVGRIYYDLRHEQGNDGLQLVGLYAYVQEDGKLGLFVRFVNRRAEIEDVDTDKIRFTITVPIDQ